MSPSKTHSTYMEIVNLPKAKYYNGYRTKILFTSISGALELQRRLLAKDMSFWNFAPSGLNKNLDSSSPNTV